MKRHHFISLIFCLLFISLWSCKSRQVHPEVPETISRTHFIREELSTIYIPIEVSLDQAERTINEMFKDEVYRDESYANNGNDDLKMIIKKFKDISIGVDGNTLKMKLPLSVWAKARQNMLGIEFSEAVNFDMNLSFSTTIDIDENWNLKTETKDFKYDFLKDPIINVGGIKIPMKGVVTKILDNKSRELLMTLDEFITESVDLRQQVDSVWKSTQYPINIDDEYNTWVKLKPTRFILSPIEGKDRRIGTAIGIESFIETKTGQIENEKLHNKPLPKLSKIDIPSDQFHIAVSNELDFHQLSDILKKELINYTYKDDNRKITMTDVSCYGNGDDMVFRFNFIGDLEGELYASGRPAYDSISKELFIEHFDFDLNTKKTLLKVANWLLKGPLKKQIQKHMRFSLKEEFDNLSQLMEESLIENTIGEGLHLDCEILDIYPKDISLTDFSVKTLVIIDGKAKIKFGR